MKIVGATGLGGLWALKWAWPTFFGQSIGIYVYIIFILLYLFLFMLINS